MDSFYERGSDNGLGRLCHDKDKLELVAALIQTGSFGLWLLNLHCKTALFCLFSACFMAMLKFAVAPWSRHPVTELKFRCDFTTAANTWELKKRVGAGRVKQFLIWKYRGIYDRDRPKQCWLVQPFTSLSRSKVMGEDLRYSLRIVSSP